MSVLSIQQSSAARNRLTREEKKVIAASAAGSVFEWYDFFLYGSLATMIGDQFFSYLPDTTRNIFALLAFAAGFLVRPLGALVFGRLGDRVGRKYTFLLTILLMGLSTFAVGFLPGYATIGAAAPIILISLRILQGLALGGEYCGALTYVAEHAQQNRRGFFTSWIQSTASLGMLLSLIIILAARVAVGEETFKEWGWRIPFLVSIILVGISIYVRLQMTETPAFLKIKEEKSQSKMPIREAFGTWANLKYALITLFGLASGLTVIWYTAQFYTLFFMQNTARIDMFSSNVLLAWALVLGIGGYAFFGALSDRIGRKKIILIGYVLAMVSIFPVYNFITKMANPALHKAQETVVVMVTADPGDCAFQFNPAGTAKFTNSCDIAKAFLNRSSVNYTVNEVAGMIPARISIGGTQIVSYDAATTDAAQSAAFSKSVGDALSAAGYPAPGTPHPDAVKLQNIFDIFRPQPFLLILAMTYLVLISAMTYAPTGAAMVEMFPTRIRYTAMSLPYNIATGWFGGLMPAAAFAMSVYAGNVYFGLWYPIAIVAMSFIVVALFLPEHHNKDIFAGD